MRSCLESTLEYLLDEQTKSLPRKVVEVVSSRTAVSGWGGAGQTPMLKKG